MDRWRSSRAPDKVSGGGVALAVASEGAKVTVLRRTLAKCESVVAEIEHRGGEAVADRCDIEHRGEVEASVERTVDRWGRIDLVVNNAQSKVYQPLRRTEADMETMVAIRPDGVLPVHADLLSVPEVIQRLRHQHGLRVIDPAAWGHERKP